jgi:type II secretory pathway component GspD/PulD (secretin)
MLRAAVLAVALLISGLLCAEDTPAKTDAANQPCSDYEKNFPSCGISKADKQKAKKLYEQGTKLAREKHFDAALEKVRAAQAISPRDMVYATAVQAVQEQVSAGELRKGNKAMLSGDANSALGAFRRAAELDPTNEYAQQRLRDAFPPPDELAGTPMFRARLGETRLQPVAGVRSFEFKGRSPEALDQFARLFGMTAVQEEGLTPRNLRIKLDNVDWETGSAIMARVCKVLMIPTSEHEVLLANDTEDNRRDLTRMSLRTFYAVGGSTAQQLTDLTTALRVLFDLRFVTANASEGSIVVRAPQQTMDAITEFLEYLQDDEPTVMLDIKVFEISATLTRELGTSVPNEFTVFNVTSEINSLVSSSSYQQIVSALEASGQTVNATTILAALLASSSSTTSSVLGQPFGVFGGGLTLTGVTIPSTTAHFSKTDSLARTVDDVLLRAGHGKAATMKVGERYPIVSSQFSATSATSSILSALGLNTTAGTTQIPSPQFSYEDLGLVLKATPQVHGKLVSLDYELTLRALGATQSNGLPLLTNREMKGTISTNDGEGVVLAGLVEKDEINAINGIPGLSALPGLGTAFSADTKEHTTDELLVVVTPHITSGRTTTGSYVRVPTNVPK